MKHIKFQIGDIVTLKSDNIEIIDKNIHIILKRGITGTIEDFSHGGYIVKWDLGNFYILRIMYNSSLKGN